MRDEIQLYPNIGLTFLEPTCAPWVTHILRSKFFERLRAISRRREKVGLSFRYHHASNPELLSADLNKVSLEFLTAESQLEVLHLPIRTASNLFRLISICRERWH